MAELITNSTTRPGPPGHPAWPSLDVDPTVAARVEQMLVQARARREPVDRPTARLLAAAVHPGAGSALERFAGTDELDSRATLLELETATHLSAPGHWQLHLTAFLLRELQAARPTGASHG